MELWKVVSVVITTVVITKVVDTTYMYFTQNTVHIDKQCIILPRDQIPTNPN